MAFNPPPGMQEEWSCAPCSVPKLFVPFTIEFHKVLSTLGHYHSLSFRDVASGVKWCDKNCFDMFYAAGYVFTRRAGK